MDGNFIKGSPLCSGDFFCRPDKLFIEPGNRITAGLRWNRRFLKFKCHTTATHLLRAGVDINTTRAWIGYVSINTNNIYAEADIEIKVKALVYCEIIEETKPIHRLDN